MMGIPLIIAGIVAFSNVGLLLYLLTERNRTIKTPEKHQETQASEPTATPKPARIGKSKTVVDDFETMVKKEIAAGLEDIRKEMRQLRDSFIGDVRQEDCEFDDAHQSSPPNDMRMSKAEADAAFEDVRIEDVEEDTVSAPSATGHTMEELDEAFKTAENPDATLEEKAKAGDIFDRLMGTTLMDMVAADEEIFKGVKACVSESIRLEISEKAPRKVKAIVKNRTTVVFPKNIEDFNPEDVFML